MLLLLNLGNVHLIFLILEVGAAEAGLDAGRGLVAQLGPDRSSDGPGEQGVHLLEGNALGLGDEEEGPDAHEGDDAPEDEVSAVAKAGDHVRGGAGDEEGPEPGVGGGNGDAEHADVEGEDLGRVGPGDALPSGADDEGIDVDGGHGEVAPSVPLGVTGGGGGGRVGSQDVAADVPERDRAKEGAPDETLATTNALNDEEGEGEHAERLKDAVQSRGEELVAGAGDAEGLKDARGVVGDDIDTGEALQEHESHADAHAVAHARSEELLELLLARHLDGGALLDLAADLGHLGADVGVVGVEAADAHQHGLGGFEVVLARQPTGGLWAESHAHSEEETGDKLDSQGHRPLRHRVHVYGLRGCVVDPEAEHAAPLRGDFEDAHETTADRGWRRLGDVHGDAHGRGADAESGDGASGDNHLHLAVGRRHEGPAEEEDAGGEEDGPASAEALSDRECQQRAEEAAGLEGGDDVALDGVAGASGDVGQAKVADEGVERHGAANHGRVVAHCIRSVHESLYGCLSLSLIHGTLG